MAMETRTHFTFRVAQVYMEPSAGSRACAKSDQRRPTLLVCQYSKFEERFSAKFLEHGRKLIFRIQKSPPRARAGTSSNCTREAERDFCLLPSPRAST